MSGTKHVQPEQGQPVAAERVDAELVNAELIGFQADNNDPKSRPALKQTRSKTQQTLFQRLLSKRSLDAMMFCGGGLLTIGFAIWLWSIGIFANAIVLATAVGLVNCALLGVGFWLSFATAYKVTGRSILLLSSLLMPLNL